MCGAEGDVECVRGGRAGSGPGGGGAAHGMRGEGRRRAGSGPGGAERRMECVREREGVGPQWGVRFRLRSISLHGLRPMEKENQIWFYVSKLPATISDFLFPYCSLPRGRFCAILN